MLLAEVVDPALTTVAAPMRKAGALGVGNVLALAAGAQTAAARPLVLPVQARGARVDGSDRRQRSRNSISPARGTTSVSGSASNAATSTDAGSR